MTNIVQQYACGNLPVKLEDDSLYVRQFRFFSANVTAYPHLNNNLCYCNFCQKGISAVLICKLFKILGVKIYHTLCLTEKIILEITKAISVLKQLPSKTNKNILPLEELCGIEIHKQYKNRESITALPLPILMQERLNAEQYCKTEFLVYNWQKLQEATEFCDLEEIFANHINMYVCTSIRD